VMRSMQVMFEDYQDEVKTLVHSSNAPEFEIAFSM
jgi:hypothetical protein